MARYTGAKDKLSRREGFDLFGKGNKLTRLNITPGVHGPRGQMGKKSQYGIQLREKQKVKRLYGVLEKQFKKYVQKAMKSKGNTPDALFSQLEGRLDNVVYRLGFAKTRPQARQLVSHRHVLVNGKRVNIPSYQVKAGDTVALGPKGIEVPMVKDLLAQKGYKSPSWLKRKAAVGQVVRKPIRDDVTEPIDEQNIIEYYSR